MCSRSRGTSWMSACCHPFLLGVACFLFIVYKILPCLFAFLLNASPVIACTTFLLGILLIYGEPNFPDKKEDDNRSHASSTIKIKSVAKNLETKNEESFKVDAHVGSRTTTKRMTVRTVVLADRRRKAASKAVEENEVNQTDATSVDSNSSVGEDSKKKNKNLIKEKGHSTGKAAEGSIKFREDIGSATASAEKNITVFDSDAGRAKSDSKWRNTDQRDASSDSGSDGEERTNSPVANATSVLDELDPLIESEASQADLVSKDNYDDVSVAFSQQVSDDDGSVEEEPDTQDEEDEEEAQGEKDRGNKVAVTWTADDHRTVVELGNTEIERNLRLENLLAKRMARKAMERNLIDLDDMEEISPSYAHMPSINATRRNPFDLPYESDEPGSAPSVLLPRRNPFDLPYEQVDNRQNLSQKEFVAVPQRDIMFRRHESFTIGASFVGDFGQEKHASRFKPFFGAERELEEAVYADMHRKLSDDSKMSSALKNDAILSKHSDSHSSDYSKSMDVELVESQINIKNEHTAELSNGIKREQPHQDTEKIGTLKEDISEESASDSTSSYAEGDEVTDEEYNSGSSFPSGAGNITSKMGTHEQTADTATTKSVAVTSDNVNVETDHAHESHVVEPVYDSSPTETKNSHSNSALDESDQISDRGLCFSMPAERNNSSIGDTEESMPSANEMQWFAPPSLASVDESESVSREIKVIKELDVIGDELCRVHKDFGAPIMRIMSAPAARKKLLHSKLSSMEMESSEDS